MLFRNVPDERYNIYDWQVAMQPMLTPGSSEGYEESMTPISPGAFNSFTNPFAARDTRTPSSSISRPELQQRPSLKSVSTYPHAPRDRPSAMISPSPSLRSRRSDLSSQSSSMHPPMGFTSSHPQSYATNLPSDLPSPASTSGYDTQFIEGWTSAQGRSSALSSHTRGSNSIASAVAPAAQIASTPPGPRETILDRAFQMRCIPGSERVDDEKISSIARFEALMREVDERKRLKSNNSAHGRTHSSSWDLDEESEESSGEEEDGEDREDEPDMSDDEIDIPTPAQRALEYISGRRPPLPSRRPLSPTPSSPPIPFLNPQALSAFHGHSSPPTNFGGLRPRTGNSTTAVQHSRTSRPNSLALPSRSISTTAIPTLKEASSASSANGNLKEKRRSSTSVKRLSFQEFAKRLSSTSSLLLVQSNTNVSSSSGREGSRRESSEYGADGDERGMRASINLRGGASETETREKRCGWRGSVGVFGGEGGFL
ncbi:hypothetical protein D0Z07_5390 [Hyphodiscus hymeniophilus]|uniref:Uncharacterized protein n=1 Tax=Hyphodiscus hymeniophilus TaxID=353542 RepID=A0A9P7AWV6_9HELO|nr:hypothetical protein D0Z07_5390 [Hyphodiscus hymeniophilus]